MLKHRTAPSQCASAAFHEPNRFTTQDDPVFEDDLAALYREAPFLFGTRFLAELHPGCSLVLDSVGRVQQIDDDVRAWNRVRPDRAIAIGDRVIAVGDFVAANLFHFLMNLIPHCVRYQIVILF